MFKLMRNIYAFPQRTSIFKPSILGYSSESVWNLGKLNHVAIAVPDLEKATSLYRDVLKADVSDQQKLPEHGVTTVFINLGNTKLELLHPLGENSPIQVSFN